MLSGRLRPAARGTDIGNAGCHQDVVHGHAQQGAQGIEVVYRGQTLAPLPLIDGLGFLKAEKLLKVSDRESPGLPQPENVGSCGRKVDDGKMVCKYDNRLHSDHVE